MDRFKVGCDYELLYPCNNRECIDESTLERRRIRVIELLKEQRIVKGLDLDSGCDRSLYCDCIECVEQIIFEPDLSDRWEVRIEQPMRPIRVAKVNLDLITAEAYSAATNRSEDVTNQRASIHRRFDPIQFVGPPSSRVPSFVQSKSR
jgi:hypothetical protein